MKHAAPKFGGNGSAGLWNSISSNSSSLFIVKIDRFEFAAYNKFEVIFLKIYLNRKLLVAWFFVIFFKFETVGSNLANGFQVLYFTNQLNRSQQNTCKP